jgi:tetratricopeptide (TPR) repeat protein
VKIFVSHASEQSELARTIEIALSGEGHAVFFDRSSLPSGDEYHERIRRAIADSDLLIFLISPESLARGRYTLNELEFAEQKWRHPAGHVLPVMTSAIDVKSIPVYLKAVTLLQPQGDIPAAVVAAVSRMSASWWSRTVRSRVWKLGAIVLLAAIGLAWYGARYLKTRAEVARFIAMGDLHRNSGAYADAWDAYTKAANIAPSRHDVAAAQQRLAMVWLDNIRVRSGVETFTGIVSKVEPVLARCAVSEELSRRADCLAYIGWGDFLRQREGNATRDPVESYRAAIAVDAQNPFAHAMWGFETVRSGKPLREAKAHFAAAFASGRERQYVRHLEIAALLWRRDADAENELIRVVNDARLANESLATDRTSRSDASRVWDVYYGRVINRYDIDSFLAAVPPADHLATFKWLFADGDLPKEKPVPYRFLLATLQEQAGARQLALATYQQLADAFKRGGEAAAANRLYARTLEAIRRLARPAATETRAPRKTAK